MTSSVKSTDLRVEIFGISVSRGLGKLTYNTKNA